MTRNLPPKKTTPDTSRERYASSVRHYFATLVSALVAGLALVAPTLRADLSPEPNPSLQPIADEYGLDEWWSDAQVGTRRAASPPPGHGMSSPSRPAIASSGFYSDEMLSFAMASDSSQPSLNTSVSSSNTSQSSPSASEVPLSPPPADSHTNQPCETAPEGMACIAGGPFLRGSNDGPKDTRPQEEVRVGTFYMDIYEVTVEAYEACVASGGCQPAKTNYADYSRPRQPKVGVNWYHAVRFCEAMGKHLPTEAEWEKAARGTDGRLYPWGNEPATCERAVIKDERGRSCGVKKLKGAHPEKGRTFEVGTRPPNQFGLYDMSGNSWEWVYDWYSTSYKACGKACQGADPRGPCNGKEPCADHTMRVVRGGSWYWPASCATTIYRRAHYPANHPYHHFGFRCAASEEEAAKLRAKGSSPSVSPQ